MENRQIFEKMTSYELLGNRRSAMREDRPAIYLFFPAYLCKPSYQSSNPDFTEYARNYGIVNTAVGEEVLVLCGDDRIPDNGRDVLVLDVPPVLFCHLNERLTIDIVNVADRRKLKAGEWSYVRKVGSVKIDVIEYDCNKSDRDDCCAYKQVNDTPLPTQSD